MPPTSQDEEDWDTYRRLILEELRRLTTENTQLKKELMEHQLQDKDNAKQVALDIQALQIAAKNAGYKAGRESGITWGAGTGSVSSAVVVVLAWLLTNWPH